MDTANVAGGSVASVDVEGKTMNWQPTSELKEASISYFGHVLFSRHHDREGWQYLQTIMKYGQGIHAGERYFMSNTGMFQEQEMPWHWTHFCVLTPPEPVAATITDTATHDDLPLFAEVEP